MMASRKKLEKLEKFAMEFLIFFIPYTTGALLYGLLEGDSIFHIPILIISVIITWTLLKKFVKTQQNGETK